MGYRIAQSEHQLSIELEAMTKCSVRGAVPHSHTWHSHWGSLYLRAWYPSRLVEHFPGRALQHVLGLTRPILYCCNAWSNSTGSFISFSCLPPMAQCSTKNLVLADLSWSWFWRNGLIADVSELGLRLRNSAYGNLPN